MSIDCGLNVPECQLEKFSEYGSTFLTKRFDRQGKRRIHFSSAMTLLGKSDGDEAQNGSSYLELAEFIMRYGAEPTRDLRALRFKTEEDGNFLNDDGSMAAPPWARLRELEEACRASTLKTNASWVCKLLICNDVPANVDLAAIIRDAVRSRTARRRCRRRALPFPPA